MCLLQSTNDYIHTRPLPADLSLPVECALSFPDRNAACSEKVLSQPTEGPGTTDPDWPGDRIWK